MNWYNEVRLKIVGTSLSPDAITARIGLQPDRTRVAGERRPRTTIVEETNLWEIQSKMPKERQLTEHIAAIATRVGPVADRIRDVATDHDVLLCCVVHGPRNPPLGLDRKAIEFLAAIRAEVDFDLYMDDDVS